MATTTENLKLTRPEATDKVARQTVIDNIDSLEQNALSKAVYDPTGTVTKYGDLAPTILTANRIYSGADLTVTHAAEIADYSDVWAWIKARTQAANYTGLHVGDYIPFVADGNTIIAEIAGLDTYYNYGDTATTHHIDFISRDCWPDAHVYNKVNYNNGTTVSPSSWLASDVYAWLNSLSMSVPNTAAANPTLAAVNYATTGVYDKLPAELQNAIVTKRLLLPSRYTATSLQTDDNNWAWADIGKLWIPSEVEVYSCKMWGTYINGYGAGGYVQYPIFANNMNRIKGAGHEGNRAAWWLSTAQSGNSTYCAAVSNDGRASYAPTSNTTIRTPLCFRIA